jgi:hypothetical protein
LKVEKIGRNGKDGEKTREVEKPGEGKIGRDYSPYVES